MKILVLGGTRFFGKSIVQKFFAKGCDVTVFTRGNQSPTDLPKVHFEKGDRTSSSDLSRLGKTSWDVVVDNIAYEGPEVEMALKCIPKVGQWILTSTVAVYRYPKKISGPTLLESEVDFEKIPPGEDLSDEHWKYARGKLETEKALMAKCQGAWTILRPPVVYGPWDFTGRGFWYLERLLSGGPLILADGGKDTTRIVFSEDVAEATVQVAYNPKTKKQIYNIAGEERLSLKQFIEDSAAFLNCRAELKSIPLIQAGDLAGSYATMPFFIQDIEKAKKDFGYKPTPWKEYGKISAQWYLKNRNPDLLKGREQELTLMKA